jgi:hypothetical protein
MTTQMGFGATISISTFSRSAHRARMAADEVLAVAASPAGGEGLGRRINGLAE